MDIKIKHEQTMTATFDRRMAQLVHDALKDSGLFELRQFKHALKVFAYDTCDRCRFVHPTHAIGDSAVCNHPYKNQFGRNPVTEQGCPWFSPVPEKAIPGEGLRYAIWCGGKEVMSLPEKAEDGAGEKND